MLANITTPLVGAVATAAIGRLGDAAALGGVAMASLVFDCLFWLCGFLRMGTVALTAQARVEDLQDSFEAGMTAHLTKPIDDTTLYRTLIEVLDMVHDRS